MAYIGGYEKALVQAARDRHVDGLVCGHIHKAEIRQIDKILYCNDGDWVESCTALVEHPDGRLEIVAWDEVNQITKSLKTALPVGLLSLPMRGISKLTAWLKAFIKQT